VKVRRYADRLQAAGATALFIVHDEAQRVRDVLLHDIGQLPFPVLVDQERQAYATWGLNRAPWWRVWLDPNVWKQYAALLRAGNRPRGAGRDTLQLGGDFVVAPDGTIAYSRPQQRDDRPPVGELLSVIDRLAQH
jgi:peroxiredoxin